MYEITVEAGFSSGHFLRNYHGKCENPHGHNYKCLRHPHRRRARRFRSPARLQAAQAGHAPGRRLPRPPHDQRTQALRRDQSLRREPRPLLLRANRRQQLREMTIRPRPRQGLHPLRNRHQLRPLLRVVSTRSVPRPTKWRPSGVRTHLQSPYAPYRTLQIRPGRVLLHRPALHLRPLCRLQPPLRLVRLRVHLHRRQALHPG